MTRYLQILRVENKFRLKDSIDSLNNLIISYETHKSMAIVYVDL